MSALAHEALEALLHRIERAMNRRKFADRGPRRFNDFRRPPERIRRHRELREGSEQTARGQNRNGGDEQRADEYRSERLGQPPARRPVAWLNRQPAAILKIHGDQKQRRQQQVLSGTKGTARKGRKGLSWHDRNRLARRPHSNSLDRGGGAVANFV